MPTKHGGRVAKNFATSARFNCLRIKTAPRLLTPCTWKTCLARSIPTVVTSIADAPTHFEWSMTLPLWHTDAVTGWGRPSIGYDKSYLTNSELRAVERGFGGKAEPRGRTAEKR